MGEGRGPPGITFPLAPPPPKKKRTHTPLRETMEVVFATFGSGHFWDHLGVNLGSRQGPLVQGTIGTILGPFLRSFWSSFGHFWDHSGSFWGHLWDDFGPFWHYFKVIFFYHFWVVFGSFLCGFGQVCTIMGHFAVILGSF